MSIELIVGVGVACVQEMVIECLRHRVSESGVAGLRYRGIPPGLTLAEISARTCLPDDLLVYYLTGMVGGGRVRMATEVNEEVGDVQFLGGESNLEFRTIYYLGDEEMKSEKCMEVRLRDCFVHAGREVRVRSHFETKG